MKYAKKMAKNRKRTVRKSSKLYKRKFVGRRKSGKGRKLIKRRVGGLGKGVIVGKGVATSKAKKFQRKPYNEVLWKLESRASVADSECVYMFHGTPTSKLWQTGWLMVVKDLYEKAGIHVQDTSITVNNIGSIELYYHLIPSTVETTITVPITAVKTVFDLSNDIVTAYQGVFGAVIAAPIFTRFVLNVETALGFDIIQSTIYTDEYSLELSHRSTLIYQNNTLAGDGGAGNIDNDLTTNVSRHPLKGRKYCFKEATQAIPGARQPNIATFAIQIGPGVSLGTNNAANLGSGGLGTFTNQFKKPPQKDFFKECYSSKELYLKSGQIGNSVNLWRKTFTWNKFVQYFDLQGKSLSISLNYAMGSFTILAYEHYMKFTGDAVISILMEENTDIMAKSYFKTKKTVPLVIVN